MQTWRLLNGMKVIYHHKPSDSVSVQVLVNVGSDAEEPKLRGISHFIEHMVFEGTTKRPTPHSVANEIERVGGEVNAYTTNGRTCFYAKVLGRHFDLALDVVSDILQNPLFRPEDVERQKSILFKEIDLVMDEPRFHQWILFQQTMFKKHPSRYPTYGSRETVTRTTAHDIAAYFHEHYFPRNMVLVIVGNVKNVQVKVQKAFTLTHNDVLKKSSFFEAAPTTTRVTLEKRAVANTYLVLGHRTVPRTHKDSYVLDVIDAVLGRGQSGWMFDEIRNKHGLAYEVGTQHMSEQDYGYFATYASVDKKNVEKVRGLILEELKRLQKITATELSEAQTFLEGDFYLSHEDTQKLADEICFWEQMGDAKAYHDYIKKIKSVTLADVRRVVLKYFEKPYCFAVIEGKR